jgi:hypothetical protein
LIFSGVKYTASGFIKCLYKTGAFWIR